MTNLTNFKQISNETKEQLRNTPIDSLTLESFNFDLSVNYSKDLPTDSQYNIRSDIYKYLISDYLTLCVTQTYSRKENNQEWIMSNTSVTIEQDSKHITIPIKNLLEVINTINLLRYDLN